jgi:hypothetical protein
MWIKHLRLVSQGKIRVDAAAAAPPHDGRNGEDFRFKHPFTMIATSLEYQ